MERKFTDDEIVKALECCSKDSMLNCRKCPYEESCNMGRSDMQKDALDLINRQKAEIERLTETSEEAVSCFHRMESLYNIKCMELKVAKTEAIKEFAERLKQHCAPGGEFGDPCGVLTATDRWIDQLVQEMTGENNGN